MLKVIAITDALIVLNLHKCLYLTYSTVLENLALRNS